MSAALSSEALRRLLGSELRRRHWGAHLNRLASWPTEHLVEMMRFLQVAPFDHDLAVHQGRGCPSCGTGPHDATTARTLMTAEDRWLSICTVCGARWLHLDE